MRSLSLHDLAFLRVAVIRIPRDDFESYSDGVSLNGLTGGHDWLGVAYIARMNYNGLQAYDTMEDYADTAAVDALNGGIGWSGAYEDETTDFGVRGYDDMESYSDAADVDGLNGGTGWSGAYAE